MGGAASCPNCGRPAEPPRPDPATMRPYQPPPPAAASESGSRGGPGVVIAGVIAAAVVVAAAFGAIAFVATRGEDTSSVTSAPTTEAPTPIPTPEAEESNQPSSGPRGGPGDVLDQPAGLFCRDLYAKGFSYVAAVDYWRESGQPNQMDEDRNGIPCQTVYSPSDVSAYWGTQSVPPQMESSVGNLPDGLFCRDLYARGYDYSQAVDYWFYQGQPPKMDADLNGVPCETVYPTSDVNDFWY